MSHHPERTARNVRPVNQPPSLTYAFAEGGVEQAEEAFKVLQTEGMRTLFCGITG